MNPVQKSRASACVCVAFVRTAPVNCLAGSVQVPSKVEWHARPSKSHAVPLLRHLQPDVLPPPHADQPARHLRTLWSAVPMCVRTLLRTAVAKAAGCARDDQQVETVAFTERQAQQDGVEGRRGIVGAVDGKQQGRQERRVSEQVQ